MIAPLFLFFTLLSAAEHDLMQLTAIRSHHSEEAGLNQIAEILKIKLEAKGFVVSWNYKTRSFKAERKPASAQFTALLVGHMDTVYGPDFVVREPELLTVEHPLPSGPAVRAPGALDAKAGIIQILRMIEILDQNPEASRLHLKIFIQADEEIGSVYSKSHLIAAAKGSDLALVFEPSWHDFQKNKRFMPTSVGGNLSVTLKIQKSTSHPGISQSLGENANDTAFEIAGRLRALRKKGISVHFSEVEGKSQKNITTARSFLKVNFRYSHETERDLILNTLRHASIALNDETTNIGRRISDIWLPHKLSTTPQLFEAFRTSALELGFSEPEAALTRTHDASSFISSIGVPVLTSMGPAGAFPHNENEIVYLGDFEKRATLACAVVLKMMADSREN